MIEPSRASRSRRCRLASGIDESRLLERLDVRFRRVGRVAEDQLQPGICGQRRIAARVKDGDEGADLGVIEEAGERLDSSLGGRQRARAVWRWHGEIIKEVRTENLERRT